MIDSAATIPRSIAGSGSKYWKVQDIILGRTPLERELCFRCEGSDTYTSLVTADGDSISSFRPATIFFDLLLNTFFENYWKSLTSFETVQLTVRYQGSPVLSVWREVRDDHGRPVRSLLLSERLPAERESASVQIESGNQALKGRPGLISFSLEDDEPFAFMGGAWAIEAPAPRRVGLSIITCTLDYGKMMPGFFEGLEGNFSDSDLHASVSSIIVVNNGPKTYDADLAARFPKVAEKLLVIHQKNLGASGGFTRGIMAAEEEGGTTHIALLDDDAILASGALPKAAALLARSSSKTIIGGQMLDLSQPNMLLASGQFFDSDTTELANPVLNIDLRNGDWKRPFLDKHMGQWNGWWLTILPREIFQEIGYPLPLFVKWDDVEYGVRASQHGYQTVTFPGVAIWHEAPDMKPITWQMYFNVRNGLIIKSMRADSSSPSWNSLRLLLAEFLSSLLTYRYYQARLVIEAMRDYLQGPEVLRRDVREHFTYLRNLTREAPSFTTEAPSQRPRWSRFAELKPSKLSLLRSLLWNCWVPVSERPAKRSIGSRFARWNAFFRADIVYIDDPSLDTVLVHRRDMRLARKLLLAFLREWWAMAWNGKRLGTRWKEAEARLTTRKSWHDVLAESEQAP